MGSVASHAPAGKEDSAISADKGDIPAVQPEGRLRRHVRVTGGVQGVFFRDTCRREAARAGVAGWVRNLPDGSVEAVFEGPGPGVRAMVEWCRSGPPRASVTDVEVIAEDPEGLTAFRVR